ncbi:hypothetical protein CEV33_3475 [Brucella grignonensis]|uniref:Uncharacterized protein n=1 Tax=Brucella grignonensis TaxID=94627 RepID=A0A256EZ46_9HYPH|nr:hypothetical protein CEV33_3475 [Brucella grignonensis]
MRGGVIFFPNVPVMRPGKLTHRDSWRDVRHSRKAEIDAIR